MQDGVKMLSVWGKSEIAFADKVINSWGCEGGCSDILVDSESSPISFSNDYELFNCRTVPHVEETAYFVQK
jgi:hypothetical protein